MMSLSQALNKMRISLLKYGMLLILISVSLPLISQQTRQQLEEKRKQLESEISYTNKLIQQTQDSKKNNLYELSLLNTKINKRSELVATLKSEMYVLDGDIETTDRSIVYLDRELTALKQEYAKLAYFAFKHKNAYDRLIYLFSADDLNQAYQRLRYLDQLSEFIRNEAEEIKQLMKTKEQLLSDLNNQKSEKKRLLENENLQLSKLEVEQIGKDRLKAKLSKKERELKNALKVKEQESANLNKKIKEIIASVTKPKPATTGKNTYELTPEETVLSESFAANRGKLPWPIERGVISETYGVHQHPVLKNVKTKNNGIDIATSKDGEARCVFNGEVVSITSITATNKAVIVKHGEYFTVYTNLDEVFVRKGDKIDTKELIGRVHTNMEGKTELHFQVWKGKILQNPSQWITNK
jgi:septal ring factor EnvC (AmiA/AmiB activator)